MKDIPKSIIWDNHACMPLRPHDSTFLPQLARLKKSGIDIVGLNVGMDLSPVETVLALLTSFRAWIAEHQDEYMIVGKSEDIQLARQSGKLGIFFDLEGGMSLNGNLDMLQTYYGLGVRWMLMTYNKNNDLAGGCHDTDKVLTSFGCKVLTEMNRIGMLPCCSPYGRAFSTRNL